ncbi:MULTISPECIES: MBL fold metallo-hydrolase [Zoogloea]|uniref:MBL fold metallo-hydrolase n=1 Tax=Zoogloea oleivorans TaxID=1552750 RepID=A0A6C2D0Q1_9RHOO|nr:MULTISPECIES: MBL fold metallo-hydrolase [Zoogloea]MBT9499396.1 MBL fold metallo-hydrolase [Zoogloea sp.]MDD2668868.1 MBL fold metallo-hydrolase [Zoogloea sp.]TYC60078.1 MBL fold metallo-hydrolase [Zoogloea oleivorans]
MIRRSLTAIAVALGVSLIPAAPACAEAPPVKTQVPGYYRMALGELEVTALYDGYIDLDTKILSNASPAEVQRLLTRMFLAGQKVQTAVNAFLINTGGKLILVDTGAAKAFGPTLGFIGDNLKAAGYSPEQVDVVLLTHLHADHAAGLLNAEGKPLFPNAEVRVTQADSDFWLSEEIAAKAPEGFRPFFQMARTAATPYQAAGKWKTFSGTAELAPGIRAVDAHGHTPGHTAYLIESKGERLLIVGDAVHSHAVQFARPEVAIEFDSDKKQAVMARKKLFAFAAKEKLAVAGMHLPFPGIGHVRTEGKGYAWVPVEFSPIRSK